MSSLLYLFWNSGEKRLRAGWRLLIHLLVFGVLVFAGIVLLGGIIGTQGITTSASTTPGDVANAMAPGDMALLSIIITLAMTASLWLMGRAVDKRPFRNYGLAIDGQWWADFAFGLGLGIALMAIIFVVEWLLGWVTVDDTFVSSGRGQPFIVGFGLVLVQFIGVGIYEEMLSRGYHLLNIAEGMNFLGERPALLLAWIASSAIFGVLHANNPNATPLSTLNITVAGLMLGLPFILTRSLALPIGLHISWNLAQGNIFGFPVSGTDAGTTIIQSVQAGPDLWTGGAFGPEAGLLGLLAMGLGAAAIIGWTHIQHGATVLQTEIASYEKPKS